MARWRKRHLPGGLSRRLARARDGVVPVHWTLSCDGSVVPDRGRMGLGVVLTTPEGERHTLSRTCGSKGCSNEAEVRALIAGLEAANQLGATHLHIRSDCDVIVQHVAGEASTNSARLATLFAQAKALMKQFDAAELRLVSRRHNAEADTLARSALGLPAKAPKPAHWRRKKR